MNYNMIIVCTTIIIFFSCKDNLEAVQNIDVKTSEPLSIMEGAKGKYTTVGAVKSSLISPKMLDYSNRNFSFHEFPEGINLDIYDDQHNKSNIIADYAIVYNKTKLIDLRGNVVYTSAKNGQLKTEQLYYDQVKQWVFTNYPVYFKSLDRVGEGIAFDSDKDFEMPYILDFSGAFNVKE